ncbi:hypothetical protein GCM10010234_41030 [Streptomyces hawaiiensis]
MPRRVAGRALRWLHDNRHRGSLPRGTTAELVDPDSVYKPCGESALAAGMVLRVPGASADETRAARELLDFAWTQFGDGALLYERQLRYPMMTDPLEVYAHFAEAGYRHDAFEELAMHLSSLVSHRAVEHMPNRRLAVANATRIAGMRPEADWGALLEATWLGQRPEPWLIDWMTAYCMTHTVFHVTNWGRQPHGLPTEVCDYLARWLPVWMEVWAEIQEWDLLGELIIVDACLPEPQCDPQMWQLLADAQHPSGLVPRDGQPLAGDAAAAYRDHHHTTAVAVMAGALAQSRYSDAPVPS